MFPTPNVEGFLVIVEELPDPEAHISIAVNYAISAFSIQEGLDEQLICIMGGQHSRQVPLLLQLLMGVQGCCEG